jgi:hypothetical protein
MEMIIIQQISDDMMQPLSGIIAVAEDLDIEQCRFSVNRSLFSYAIMLPFIHLPIKINVNSNAKAVRRGEEAMHPISFFLFPFWPGTTMCGELLCWEVQWILEIKF